MTDVVIVNGSTRNQRPRHGLMWWLFVGSWWMPFAWCSGYGWLWHRRSR